MTALSSLQNSISSLINSEFGLGEDVVYTDLDGETHDTRVVRQYKTDIHQKEIQSDTISDEDIFLIELSFEPKRNETIELNSKIYYVGYYDPVSATQHRVFTSSNSQTIPSRNNRQEI